MRRHPRIPDALIALSVLAGVFGPGSGHAAALSNQDFAAEVRGWRGQFAAQESAAGQAALLCTNLPPHRSADEPQCVALRLHLRAQARRAAGVDPTLLGCARSALSAALSGLASRAGAAV